DRVRRRYRNAEPGGYLDDRGRGRLRRETVHRLQRGDAHTHRADDPPTAGGGTEADRERADDLDPRVDHKGTGTSVEGVKRKGDDAHRLLAVVATVAERHVRAGEDLRSAEEAVHEAIAHVPQAPVES